jgi:hypothetical protein
MADHNEASTDRDSGSVDETDPLLVRPWMSGGPSASRWEATADRPARHAAAHRAVASPIALPGAAPASRPSRRRRWGFVVAAAVVVVLAVAGWAVLRPGDSPGRPASAPVVSLPPLSSAAPVSPPAFPAITPSAGAPATRRSPTGRATTTSIAPAAGATTNPDATTPGSAATTPGTAAMAPPAVPAVARTGVIVAAGGRCLDLNGANQTDGTQVQMFGCNGTVAQKWTIETDGTLRVMGRCAEQIGNSLVDIAGCDARTEEQWRAAPDGALVNLKSGNCLTDPDHSAADFTRVTVTLCTGGADSGQRWTLP